MLKFLSRRDRTRKLLLWGFVFLLALGLIVVFVPSDSGLRGAGGDETVIASVAGYDVTLKEFRQNLSAYGRNIAAGQGSTRVDDPSTVNALYGPQVLQGLIRQKLILYKADQLNFHTSDAELQDRLKQMFNPWPGAEMYRRQIQQAGTTPIEFEDTIRASIAEEKLRSYIGAGAQVSPQEVEADYRRNNTNYKVRWVEVTPDQVRDKVQMNEADLRAYFEQKKADFRIDKEQRRARYIFVDQNKAGETLQFSDDELKPDFIPERGVKQIRVSQIVLNIPKSLPKSDSKKDSAQKPDTPASVVQMEERPEDRIKSLADEIVRRATGEADKPAEDFAALVSQHSEDAKSKSNGGDIGFINKDDKRDTDDPLNRVFTMQEGEVSQPLRKGDKFYILKVTERKMPTFEESREQLVKEARAKKGYSKAVEIVDEVERKFKETKNAESVVAEINAKYGREVTTVKETAFFSEGDNLPDLGVAPEFQTKVFELTNISDVTERSNVRNGFAVAQYTEKRDPHDAEFEEVKSRVEARFREDKAKELAAEQARKLAQAGTPDALKAAATSAGLKADERDGLTGNDSIGSLVSETTRSRVHNLNPGEVTPEPIKADNSDAYVVASLISRKDPDMGEAFQSQRKSIEEGLLNSRRTTLFLNYLTAIEKELTAEGKIKIYQDVIDAALGPAVPPAGLPGGGGFPGQPLGNPGLPGRTSPGRPVTPGSLPGQ